MHGAAGLHLREGLRRPVLLRRRKEAHRRRAEGRRGLRRGHLSYYGSDVEATLRAGYDIRHGLIGAGVYASHGYERSHRDGVLNTLRVLRGYLF